MNPQEEKVNIITEVSGCLDVPKGFVCGVQCTHVRHVVSEEARPATSVHGSPAAHRGC